MAGTAIAVSCCALLSPGSGSTVVEATEATFLSRPGASGEPVTRYVAWICTPAPAPSVPRAHGKPPAQGADTDTRVKPGGVGSLRTTACASLGPALVTVIWY